MKVSRIWRIVQIKETWSKICIIHHILRKLNSIALLFNNQNIFKLLKEKMSSFTLFFCSPKITKPHPQVFLVNGSIICSSLHFWHHFDVYSSIICSELHFWHHFDVIGSIICSALHFWHHFEVIGRAALLTSFWCHRFNNLQQTALLTSLVLYDKICSKFGQQQLVMVNYAVCGFNQPETGKYFEWIIIAFIWCCEFNAKSLPPNNCSKQRYLRWWGLHKPCILIHAHHDTDLNQTVP